LPSRSPKKEIPFLEAGAEILLPLRQNVHRDKRDGALWSHYPGKNIEMFVN
jgi:hypothetical protein